MKKSINSQYRDDFIDKFMHAYKSPGVRVPFIRMAYGKPFELIEYNSAYKVTIRDKTRRYTNLFKVAEFIYDENYDAMHVYVSQLTDKQKEKRERKKRSAIYALRCCLKDIFSFANPLQKVA